MAPALLFSIDSLNIYGVPPPGIAEEGKRVHKIIAALVIAAADSILHNALGGKKRIAFWENDLVPEMAALRKNFSHVQQLVQGAPSLPAQIDRCALDILEAIRPLSRLACEFPMAISMEKAWLKPKPKERIVVRICNMLSEMQASFPVDEYLRGLRDAVITVYPSSAKLAPKSSAVIFHGGCSYSIARMKPRCVTKDEHAALQRFLNERRSLTTAELEDVHGGISDNAPRVMKHLAQKFPGAVRFPEKKCDGYFIEVCSA